MNNPSYSGGYNYDAGGNVARDSTKGIVSSDITYTYFNKPSFMTFSPSGGRLYYSYDAAGNKVQEYINFGTNNIFTQVTILTLRVAKYLQSILTVKQKGYC